jgi:hypothetical protein
MNSNVVVFDSAMPKDFRYPDRIEADQPAGVVGPNVPVVFPLDIAIADIVDIQNSRKSGYLYGWAEYDDIFPDTPRRRTEFCMLIDVFGDPHHIPAERGGPSVLGFVARGPYNGTDDECFYKPGQGVPVARAGELPAMTQPPPMDETTV